MRISFVTSKINFENAGGSVPDLDCKVRAMQELGAQARVITLYSHFNKLPALPYAVIEEHAPAGIVGMQRKVYQILKAHGKDTDVFHVEGQYAYGAAVYRLLGGKPVVAHYNRELISENGNALNVRMRRVIEKLLHKVLLPSIDHFIFTTPFLRTYYEVRGLRRPASQSSVVLDFLDPTQMLNTIEPRVPRNAADTTLRIIASGRMIEQKGFHLLIEALSLLPDETRKKVHVTISGDGPERARLAEMVHEQKLSEIVSLPGWIEKADFWQRLAGSDVFVLPRWRIEQPSMIVMEALALGVPTVAPGGGGVEWMAGEAIAPFVDSDVHSLSATLERLIEHTEERERLAKAAKARWKDLDFHTRAPQLFHILEAVT